MSMSALIRAFRSPPSASSRHLYYPAVHHVLDRSIAEVGMTRLSTGHIVCWGCCRLGSLQEVETGRESIFRTLRFPLRLCRGYALLNAPAGVFMRKIDKDFTTPPPGSAVVSCLPKA